MEILRLFYNDIKNSRYSLFLDEKDKVIFCFWKELFEQTPCIRGLDVGSEVEVSYTSLEKKASKKPKSYRGLCKSSVSVLGKHPISLDDILFNEFKEYDENGKIVPINQKIFKKIISNPSGRHIIFHQYCFDKIELENIDISSELVFIDCSFTADFRLLECNIFESIWFINSQFTSHFSLKKSIISKDIHMEGSDFSGAGGVSFRKTQANNLYLDFGVKGPNDLIWINEVKIDEVLSIGGDFISEIQMLTSQDNPAEIGALTPEEWMSIGSVIIGEELYEQENVNRTTISDKITIKGLRTEEIKFNNLQIGSIEVNHVEASIISMNEIGTSTDLVINHSILTKENKEEETDSLLITGSSIGRHMKLSDNTFNGLVSLEGSAISEVTTLDDNTFNPVARLNVTRLTSGRFLIYPESCLYHQSGFNLLKPKNFGLIKESSSLTKKCRENIDRDLGDQFCSLKHWLSDAGKLDLEDAAYFHMREKYHPNAFTKFFLSTIFGWGVRLSNVAIWSSILIILFAWGYAYLDQKMSFLTAIALSVQSFISSFFGTWANYDPSGWISNIITLESCLGVLFITVFIGAYVRKLLR